MCNPCHRTYTCTDALTAIALCYKYWIALTDCDGFRIDTLKHTAEHEARAFLGTVTEFADNLGKDNFLIVGEVSGGADAQGWYKDALERNMSATLDISGLRSTMGRVVKGLDPPRAFFKGVTWAHDMGSHRFAGSRRVAVLDDHDNGAGWKLRFSARASSPQQAAAGAAFQLLTLGIPCLYYGTEQCLAGPEPGEWPSLTYFWNREGGPERADYLLREAMFGPEYPLKDGDRWMPGGDGLPVRDPSLPGFGPFGTSGLHCFNPDHPTYVRIAAVAALRARIPALRAGRQYMRPTRNYGAPFGDPDPGELVAWSRVLDGDEVLCVLNSNGEHDRGGDVLVDPNLNPSHDSSGQPTGNVMTVLLNTAETAARAAGQTYGGTHSVGSTVPVLRANDGTHHLEIRDVPSAEVIVLSNHAWLPPPP